MALAEKIPGLRPVDAGPLVNARHVETTTVLLLNLNRIHKAETGVRIVGLEAGRPPRSPS
jgi:predicted dinucleotide-binding enzyme